MNSAERNEKGLEIAKRLFASGDVNKIEVGTAAGLVSIHQKTRKTARLFSRDWNSRIFMRREAYHVYIPTPLTIGQKRVIFST